MATRDLIPFWRRSVARSGEAANPFLSMQQEMDRMFDEMSRRFGLLSPGENGGTAPTLISPRMNVSEDDKEIRVTAELPGMEEKDIDVTFEEGVLTVSGEKKAEHEEKGEEKGKEYHLMERSYGSFHRALPIGNRVDEEKIAASFNNGVLTVTLPKTAEAQRKTKKIPIGH